MLGYIDRADSSESEICALFISLLPLLMLKHAFGWLAYFHNSLFSACQCYNYIYVSIFLKSTNLKFDNFFILKWHILHSKWQNTSYCVNVFLKSVHITESLSLQFSTLTANNPIERSGYFLKKKKKKKVPS